MGLHVTKVLCQCLEGMQVGLQADVSRVWGSTTIMCSVCDTYNVWTMQGAEFGMRGELVLKTAVLAERFYPDLHWYVDSMLKLIERAGELASKDIWHSTVQLITNYPALHEYAARKVHSQFLFLRNHRHEQACS